MACDGKEERVAVPVREERTSMIDKKAFYRLSYGMFVITTKGGERPVGCIVNTFGQVTSSPFQVSVAVNKENATCRALQSQGRYVAACLGESASMELIGTFGFRTSDDCDKFEGFPTAFDEAGIPYVDEGYVARFSVRIVNSVDVGTHIVFIGERPRLREAHRQRGHHSQGRISFYPCDGGGVPGEKSRDRQPEDRVGHHEEPACPDDPGRKLGKPTGTAGEEPGVVLLSHAIQSGYVPLILTRAL